MRKVVFCVALVTVLSGAAFAQSKLEQERVRFVMKDGKVVKNEFGSK